MGIFGLIAKLIVSFGRFILIAFIIGFVIWMLKRSLSPAQPERKQQIPEPEGFNESNSEPRMDPLEWAYTVLGIPANVRNSAEKLSLEDYKRFYLAEINKWHPDKFSSHSEDLKREATKKIQEINRAWEIIQASR